VEHFLRTALNIMTLGTKLKKMAVDILEGKQPSEIPVGYPDNLEIVINKKAAAQEGITLTNEMLKDAKIVAESNPFST
jgi:putative ABC transport system substrate-binding protein